MKKSKIILSIILFVLILIIIWQAFPTPDFSLKYSVENGMANYKAEIEITEDGTYMYKLLSLMDKKPTSFSVKLSKNEMHSLGRLIMRNYFFFLLPNDLSRDFRTDQDEESIEINWRGKKYSSGGYDVGNIFFRATVSKLWSCKEKFK